MAEDLKTKVTIGGETSGLSAAFSEAAAIVKERSAEIVESLKGVRESLESVTGKFELLGGGILAALGLEEFNSKMTESAASVRSLALAMGSSVEDASVLRSQLNTIGASSETFVGALDHLARQLKTNEDGINSLGIATRNADGTTRDSQSVMMDALRAVQQYKPGLDQAQASMYLFGRSVQQVRELMPLLNQNTDEAREKAKALGLVLGDDQVAAANRYKIALNESKEVVEGVFTTIGAELIPTLTDAANAFNETGPQIVEVARLIGSVLVEAIKTLGSTAATVFGAIKTYIADLKSVMDSFSEKSEEDSTIFNRAWDGVKIAFLSFSAFIQVGWAEIIRYTEEAGNVFRTFGNVAQDALNRDWAKLAADYEAGNKRLGDIEQASADRIAKIWHDVKINEPGFLTKGPTKEEMLAFMGEGGEDPLKIKSGKQGFTAPQKEDLAGRDAVLQAQLAGEVAIVKEYVKEQDTELKRGYADGLVSLKDYYAQRLALSQLELDTEISVAERLKKAAEERSAVATAAKDDKGVQAALAEQIKLEDQLIVLRQKRAAVTKESAAAEADAERDLANKVADIRIAGREKADTAALDSQRKLIEYEQRLGQISNADAIAAYRRLEDERYRIAVEAARARAALEEQGPLEQAKLDAKLETLEAEHQDKLSDIVLKASKERADIEQKAIDALQSGFAQLFDSITTKQQSLLKDFQNFFNSIFASMSKLASQEIAKQMFGALGTGTGTSSAAGGGGFGSLFGAAAGGIASFFGPQDLTGVYEGGTPYVPRTGIAMLHQGERVLTRQENLEYGSGGDTIHVHNNFSVQGETTYESRAAIASTIGRTLAAARRNF